jgi:DHA2 family multidrug resistance protein-like MFS transporter
MGFATLPVLFSEDERPRAVGIMAAATFVSLPLGPILGGWLLTHAWWGWVFLINVPVACRPDRHRSRSCPRHARSASRA